jgi:hypothetical protein
MKIDWGSLYSGMTATDTRMEVLRLACKVCGGLQEQCTCETMEDQEFYEGMIEDRDRE